MEGFGVDQERGLPPKIKMTPDGSGMSDSFCLPLSIMYSGKTISQCSNYQSWKGASSQYKNRDQLNVSILKLNQMYTKGEVPEGIENVMQLYIWVDATFSEMRSWIERNQALLFQRVRKTEAIHTAIVASMCIAVGVNRTIEMNPCESPPKFILTPKQNSKTLPLLLAGDSQKEIQTGDKQGEKGSQKMIYLCRCITTIHVITTLYSLITIPYRIGYNSSSSSDSVAVDIISDIVTIANIFKGLTCPQSRAGLLVSAPRDIRRMYMRSKRFYIDVIAALPLSLICRYQCTWYRLNKLLLVLTLGYYSETLVLGVGIQYWYRSLCLVIQFYLFVHVLAVIGHECSTLVPHEDSLQFYKLSLGDLPTYDQYLYMVWYSLTAACGYNSLWPVHDYHVIYVTAVSIVGLAVYVTVLAAIASLLQGSTKLTAMYREKLDMAKSFLQYMQMPKEYEQEVLAYYKHRWDTTKHFTQDATTDMLEDLPEELFDKVSFAISFRLIQSIPMFRHITDMDFISEVAAALTIEVVFPGALVIPQDSYALDLYFVVKGELMVEVEEGYGITILGRITEGCSFGETGILYGGYCHASVRAATFSTLYRLSKDLFQEISRRYPQCLTKLTDAVYELHDGTGSSSSYNTDVSLVDLSETCDAGGTSHSTESVKHPTFIPFDNCPPPPPGGFRKPLLSKVVSSNCLYQPTSRKSTGSAGISSNHFYTHGLATHRASVASNSNPSQQSKNLRMRHRPSSYMDGSRFRPMPLMHEITRPSDGSLVALLATDFSQSQSTATSRGLLGTSNYSRNVLSPVLPESFLSVSNNPSF